MENTASAIHTTQPSNNSYKTIKRSTLLGSFNHTPNGCMFGSHCFRLKHGYIINIQDSVLVARTHTV